LCGFGLTKISQVTSGCTLFPVKRTPVLLSNTNVW